MGNKQSIFTLLLVFLLLNLGFSVSAKNAGFQMEQISDKDKETFLSGVDLTLITEEPSKKAIECFDVNENGSIAIGQQNNDHKKVCVYSADGIFQYGYSFESSGGFGVEWDNDNLNIYFVRSDVAIAVKPDGEIDSVLKIQSISENNSYWNDSVLSPQRKVGDKEYTLKNNMGIMNLFASSYSQLVVSDANGENIIYDASSAQSVSMLAVVIIMALVGSLTLLVVFSRFKNNTGAASTHS